MEQAGIEVGHADTQQVQGPGLEVVCVFVELFATGGLEVVFVFVELFGTGVGYVEDASAREVLCSMVGFGN